METNEITSTIIQTSIKIHKELGPGLLESVYETVLAKMLADKDIEIVQWVKFNNPNAKEEIKKLIEESTSKMDFVSKLKNLGISILNSMTIADNFYKK